MAISALFTIILTSIAIGSSVAYGILVSLNVSGLISSYIVCIASILHARLTGKSLRQSSFRLGRLVVPVNFVALCFLCTVWIFQFFPASPDPSPVDMNWSCAIWFALVALFMTYYFVRRRFTYIGPVDHVKQTG